MTDAVVLQALLDVEWVVGYFVGTAVGDLVVYDMPDEFGEAELSRTTQRLANIVRCASLCGMTVDQCNLSLSRYQLVLRPFSGGYLCVMVEAPVSKRALNMALKLALLDLPAQLQEVLSHWGEDKAERPAVTAPDSPSAEAPEQTASLRQQQGKAVRAGALP